MWISIVRIAVQKWKERTMNDIERTNKLKVYRFPSQEKYHCQQCRHEIPFKNRKDIDFNYCPYCGESLFGKELNNE